MILYASKARSIQPPEEFRSVLFRQISPGCRPVNQKVQVGVPIPDAEPESGAKTEPLIALGQA